MSAMPKTVPLKIHDIPAELTGRPQWVGWRWRRAREKWTKNPINPATGGLASHADAATWGAFEAALAARDEYRLDGIGFVFSADDPYAGIDLDGCVNPVTGAVAEWAQNIIDEAETYAEISPSGTGIKLIVRGELPDGKGRKKPEIEMYDRLRFFTITGQHVAGTPRRIKERESFLCDLYRRTFPPDDKPKVTPIRSAMTIDDRDVIERASSAANGAKFRRLFDGETNGYGSQSEADLALCSMIAFWTGPDEEQIDRIFRQSALYRPKWEREDYRTSTITIACDRADYWEPSDDGGTAIVFDTVFGEKPAPAPDAPVVPYLIQLADGLKEPRKADTWLVNGIVREQAVQIIVGPPKTYKSFFAQELSVAVGTGTPMFGEFSAGEPRRVLYVQEESARSHLWTRYEGILRGRGMHPESTRDQVFVITNQGVRLDDATSLGQLLTEGIEAVEPDLVIFDPLRELHWQDENKAEVMLPILRSFKEMRDRYHLSVAIIHHNNKNPLYTSPADSIRGTSAIWGAMDGGVFIGTTDDDDVMKVTLNLKEGGQAAPFLYSITSSEDGIRFRVVETEGGKKPAFDRMEVVRWAREQGAWWDIAGALEAFPRSEKIVRDAVRDLVRSGHLIERPARFGKKEYAHPEVNDDATF